MRFEWDEEKRLSNLKKHGFDFADAVKIFTPDALTILDDRFDYGEIRIITFGLLNGETVAVAHTEDVEIIRVISMRKAEKDEEIEYFKQIRNRLGKN